ncbi:MAG TPA: hypothetical protein VF748_12770 [Candidatus Acidoferrum sp.]
MGAADYAIFGLIFRSNTRLPGLTPLSSPVTSPDIQVRLGIPPHSEFEVPPEEEELNDISPFTTETGEPVRRMWRVAKGKFLRIAYFDGTQFWLDRKQENLWATWPATSSLENTLTYLLGPVLGIVLRLRGVTCLHASSVSFRDYAVAFVGWAGAGKSTTAAAFACQGYAVLSDDIVALVEKEGVFHTLPAYPHLCLWPDSVEMLYGAPEALPRFVADWEKRRLPLGIDGKRFESRVLPLGAVYILGDRLPEPAPYIEGVAAPDALMSLVTETYANKMLDRELRAREFALLARLVANLPIRRIHPHQDGSRLQEFCQLIREDFTNLNLPVSPNLDRLSLAQVAEECGHSNSG